jgi:hypothetical protein
MHDIKETKDQITTHCNRVRFVQSILQLILVQAEGISAYLADQIRIAGKTDKRIKYVIHNHHIASKLLNWRWRKYKGINPHTKHIHISFHPNQKGEFFNIPLLGGNA